MKGVVFTEFLEFVEEKYGFDTVDIMLETSGQSGVYTQAGNYPFEEMLALIVALSKSTNVAINTLLETYATHLFSRLISLYPHANRFTSAFDMISQVDNVIHPEVKKLYPDADLPSFYVKEHSDNKMVLQYMSNKPLHYFAKGLMMGAAKHFGETINVTIYDDRTPIEIEVTKEHG
jgi:hypothetical protein